MSLIESIKTWWKSKDPHTVEQYERRSGPTKPNPIIGMATRPSPKTHYSWTEVLETLGAVQKRANYEAGDRLPDGTSYMKWVQVENASKELEAAIKAVVK